MLLTNRGIELSADLLRKHNDYSKLKKLLARYTIFYKVNRLYTKKILLYQIIKKENIILLPRQAQKFIHEEHYLPDNISTELTTTIGYGLPLEIKMNDEYQPLDGQKDMYKYLKRNIFTTSNIQQGFASCILKMPTGTGKTYLALYLMSKIKKKTLIIVPNRLLLNQWEEAIKKYLILTEPIGKYYTDAKVDQSIMIMIINSAISDDFIFTNRENSVKFQDYFKEFGFLIIDECHLYTHKSGLSLLRRCQVRYQLGLSATPEYNKHHTKLLEDCIGPVIDIKTVSNCVSTNWKIETTFVWYSGSPDYIKPTIDANGNYSYSQMLEQLHNDPDRNALLLKKIDQLYIEGYNIYVFSMRREHTKGLQATIVRKYGSELVFTEDSSVLIGGAKKEDFIKALTKSRIIFTTYQYASCGISLIKMNACVFASPKRSNFEQIIGRILRHGSDTTIVRKVIDIIDCSTFLRRQHTDRKKVYQAYKAKIINEHIQA